MLKQFMGIELKENLFNIPNFLSALRIVMSPFLFLLVHLRIDMWIVLSYFIFAALTDAADGFIARRYSLVTEFGRRIDMIADRILMVCAMGALIYYSYITDTLTEYKIFLLMLLLSREIIATPFIIYSFFKAKNYIPHVRLVGKLTTLLQGVSLPIVILGWHSGIFFAMLTCVVGTISGLVYAKDSFSKVSYAPLHMDHNVYRAEIAKQEAELTKKTEKSSAKKGKASKKKSSK